jgi:dipeptidyl aminopeptidase/acylaminoacyl peptidase
VSDTLGLCRLYGEGRFGYDSVVAGVLQRLGVETDGSRVAFEVTDDLSFFPFSAVPPEAEGMFVVQADGSGLRRIGPASREPSFRIVPAASSPVGFSVTVANSLPFSPDGRRVAFTDLGPGADGEETAPIWVLDLEAGERTQVTSLPAASSSNPAVPVTCCPFFEDDQTILFSTYADPSGLNPDGTFRVFRVRIDGTGLRVFPAPVAVPGSQVVPTFRTTGLGRSIIESDLYARDGCRAKSRDRSVPGVGEGTRKLHPDGPIGIDGQTARPGELA